MMSFLKMGGYAFYVWTSYGIVFVALFLSGWQARRRLQRLVKNFKT